MKLRSRVNGAVIDINDEGGNTLLAAGIYDAIDEPKPSKEPPKKQPAPDKSTKVEPLTTEDMPTPPKKVK